MELKPHIPYREAELPINIACKNINIYIETVLHVIRVNDYMCTDRQTVLTIHYT